MFDIFFIVMKLLIMKCKCKLHLQLNIFYILKYVFNYFVIEYNLDNLSL